MEITLEERKQLDHFQKCLNIYDYGSEEYELARKVYAWLCRKIRNKQELKEV